MEIGPNEDNPVIPPFPSQEVGYEGGAHLSDHPAERNRATPHGLWLASEHPEESADAALREAKALLATTERETEDTTQHGVRYFGQRVLTNGTMLGHAAEALAEALARFCAAGALLLALAVPASAAKVPCPADAPAGATCHLAVRTKPAARLQCKGKTKTGARCTRTVGVSKATGFCAQHKAQAGAAK